MLIRTLLPLALLTTALLAGCTGGSAPRATPASSPPTSPPGSTTEARPYTPTPTSAPLPSIGRLAYIYKGDIWVKAFPTGDTQRLTTDSRNQEPRWSRSGQWLAFRKGDDQVWVTRADGSAIRALDDRGAIRAFAWAPEADRLAYVTASGILLVENADGSDKRQAAPQDIDGKRGFVLSLSWRPDGERLAYVEHRREPGEEEDYIYAGLWHVRTDGSEATELYVNEGAPPDWSLGDIVLAGWSTDGGHILFWRNPSFSASGLMGGLPLFAIPAGGDAPTQLSEAVQYRQGPVPGPGSGPRVAVIVGRGREMWTNKALHILSIPTGEDRALTSSDVAATSPAWSPDGQRIAYTAMPDQPEGAGGEPARQAMMQRRILVTSTQGEPQPQRLIEDSAYRDEYPLWSVDGAFILFTRLDEQDRASLWLVPGRGGQPRQVVPELSLSPTGPSGAPLWFGSYGHTDWSTFFDWWRGQ